MSRRNIGKILMISTLVLLLSACACEHEWQDATCTNPKTCVKCEEIEGDVLPHQWGDATCTTPKTCMECGEKTGTPLSHQWNEATCVLPKMCGECGLTDGSAMEHQWSKATCTTSKTCVLCREIDGEPLGHIAGEWEIDESSRKVSSGTVWVKQYCQVCDETVDQKLKSFSLIDGDHFLFTPNEFVDRMKSLNNILDFSSSDPVLAITPEGEMGISLCKGDAIGLFLSEEFGWMSGELSDTSGICTIYTTFFTQDMDEIVEIVVAMILACDNSLEVSDAVNVARSTVLSMINNEPYYHNELGYVFGEENGQYKLVISIAQ